MKINADFGQRVVLHAEDIPWLDSPMAGVTRRPLDRIGGEVARATTIVRFAPESHFSPHTHDGGEEFVVLEGVFEDEHGAFPVGSYVRNPPTSSHTPGSSPGCTIFVKLWQFDPDDRTHVRIDTGKIGAVPDPERPGVAVTPLFRDTHEDVRVETWAPGTAARLPVAGGAEILLLEGSGTESGDAVRQHSWVRVPVGGEIDFAAGPEGAKLWIKTGHLREVRAPS